VLYSLYSGVLSLKSTSLGNIKSKSRVLVRKTCVACIFSVYISDINTSFHITKGCSVILYADNKLLLLPSITELERLLHCCERELNYLDMNINFKKLSCLRIGPRRDATCANVVSLNGSVSHVSPGTLFLLISTILKTLIRSENHSRVYFLIVLTTDYCWRSWTCRIAAPYKFYVD